MMNVKDRIAFFCHFVTALGLAAFGIVYLSSKQFMPYHEAAVGVAWAELEPAFQILLLALLKAAGAGFIGIALTIGILLLIPFRKGERWVRWAIPVIGMSAFVPLLYAVATVKMFTPASPPLFLLLGGIALMAVGAVLTLDLKG